MARIRLTIRPVITGDRARMLALARTLEDWFDEAGLAQMERDLATREEYGGFVALHVRRIIGFLRVDPNYYGKGDRRYDRLVMQLDLSAENARRPERRSTRRIREGSV